MNTLSHHQNPSDPRRSLLRNSAVLVSIELVTKLLGLIVFAMLARFLGAATLGLYAYALTVANLFAIASRFGLDRLVQRDLGRDGFLRSGDLWQLLALKSGLTLLAVGLLWLALIALGEAQTGLAMLVGWFAFTYTYLEFLNALCRGLHRPDLEVIARLCFSVTNLAVTGTILALGYSLSAVVAGQAAAASLSGLLALLLVRRISLPSPLSWDWSGMRRRLVTALPFAAILLAQYGGNQFGVLALAWLTNQEAVGYFAAAGRLFDNLTLIAAAIMGAFLPTISRLYGASLGAFVRTLRFSLKYLFILSAPIALITGILADPICRWLYGQAFVHSALPLQVLASALVFSFWNYAGDSVLIAQNRERLLLALLGIEAAVQIGACLLLIPKFSYLGTCWAVLVTQASHSLMLLAALRRHLGGLAFARHLVAPSLAAALMGGVLLVLADHSLTVALLLGVAAYGAALLGMRAVSTCELRPFLGTTPGPLEPLLRRL